MSEKICIVDFGLGNHSSISSSLEKMQYFFRISSKPEDINEADQIILPGVGAFPEAMKSLHERKLVAPIMQAAKNNKRIIGICLGMQILADKSEEFEGSKGLGLIPGKIVKLPNGSFHIGWNEITSKRNDKYKNNIFKNKSAHYYFNHSLVFQGQPDYVIAETKTTEFFPSIIRKNKIIGLQFHPEKSQRYGRLLLKQILNGKLDA